MLSKNAKILLLLHPNINFVHSYIYKFCDKLYLHIFLSQNIFIKNRIGRASNTKHFEPVSMVLHCGRCANIKFACFPFQPLNQRTTKYKILKLNQAFFFAIEQKQEEQRDKTQHKPIFLSANASRTHANPWRERWKETWHKNIKESRPTKSLPNQPDKSEDDNVHKM